MNIRMESWSRVMIQGEKSVLVECYCDDVGCYHLDHRLDIRNHAMFILKISVERTDRSMRQTRQFKQLAMVMIHDGWLQTQMKSAKTSIKARNKTNPWRPRRASSSILLTVPTYTPWHTLIHTRGIWGKEISGSVHFPAANLGPGGPFTKTLRKKNSTQSC